MKTSLGPSRDNPNPLVQPGHSLWIEDGEWFTAPIVDQHFFGRHAYEGHGWNFGIRHCPCGCHMEHDHSSGPVDPFGPCPANPICLSDPNPVRELFAQARALLDQPKLTNEPLEPPQPSRGELCLLRKIKDWMANYLANHNSYPYEHLKALHDEIRDYLATGLYYDPADALRIEVLNFAAGLEQQAARLTSHPNAEEEDRARAQALLDVVAELKTLAGATLASSADPDNQPEAPKP